MRENVVRLVDVRRRAAWTKDDLAQLHRAAGALRHFGRSLETDGGVTDEGEPWFAICHVESGDVITHFARIGGAYVVCAPFLRGSLRGRTLSELIERFLDRYRAVAVPGTDDSVKPLYRRGR
jgi:hypothetical protein